MELGKVSLGSLTLKGAYGPSTLSLSNCSRQYACASGETLETSSLVMLSRVKGGGFSGNGWVGQDCSPGTSLGGTRRSSTPQTGLPVRRSSTKSRPFFENSATAGTRLPLAVASTRD